VFTTFTKGVGFALSPQGRRVIRYSVAAARSEEARRLAAHAHRVATSPEARRLAGEAAKVAASAGTQAGRAVRSAEVNERIRKAAHYLATRKA
jgi:hypothetical protein